MNSVENASQVQRRLWKELLADMGCCAQAGVPVCMLQEQYRMHPAISAWPSRFFYAGRLSDAESVQGRGRAAAFHRQSCFPPLAFYDCRCASLAVQGLQTNISPSFAIQAHNVRRQTASRPSDCREIEILAQSKMSDVLAIEMHQDLLMRVSHVLQRWQRGERQPQRGLRLERSGGGACVHAGFRCAAAFQSSCCALPLKTQI